MAQPFATVNEMTELFRAMTADEQARAAKLLPIVSDTLRVEARNAGKDLDRMIAADCSGAYANVVKSVTVDVTARALMTPTNEAPMSQFAQSALGYSVSGTFGSGRRALRQTRGAAPTGTARTEGRVHPT